jgi:hypothetical protein
MLSRRSPDASRRVVLRAAGSGAAENRFVRAPHEELGRPQPDECRFDAAGSGWASRLSFQARRMRPNSADDSSPRKSVV